MELLLILTLIYAAVLVLALAVSLITIWIYLRRIAGALDDARAHLATVRDETEALTPPLEQLEAISAEYANDLEVAQEHLGRAHDRLLALVEQIGLVNVRR